VVAQDFKMATGSIPQFREDKTLYAEVRKLFSYTQDRCWLEKACSLLIIWLSES